MAHEDNPNSKEHLRSILEDLCSDPDEANAFATIASILQQAEHIDALQSEIGAMRAQMQEEIDRLRERVRELNAENRRLRLPDQAVQLKLFGTVQGGCPLSNFPKHHHDFLAVVVRSRPDRPGKQIADCPALPTAVLHNQSTRAIMRSLVVGKLVPIRAAQALRLQSIEKILVAFPRQLSGKIGDRKPHHVGRLRD